MKKTKRPKKVKIIYRKVNFEVSSYTCPTCKTQFEGAGIKDNILRFICGCGQELIVDKD